VNVFRAYRSLWADRALVRLLFGEFVSSIGDWLYLVALLVIVYERSADPVLLGVVGAARVLPYVFLSVPAGIVADRYDRRLVLLSTDLARGAIMLVLAAVVAVDGPLWAVVALSILATCFSSFFGPTIGAFLPTLVGDESRLGPANSAWASLDNLAFIIGPAIGGLLIAASGTTLAFVLNAVSFAVVAVVLWRLPSTRGRVASSADGIGPSETAPLSGAGAPAPTTQEPHSEGPRADLIPAGAIRSALIPILGLGLLDLVSSFAFGGLSVLTVVLAGSAFGSNEAATGYLNAAIGVGGLVGAVAAGAFVLRPRLDGPLLGGAAFLAVGLGTLGLVGSLAPALVAMAVAAGGSLVVEVVDTTIFQRVVPDHVRGRALGAIATVTTLAYAAGSFAVPVLAGAFGSSVVLIASAGAVLIAAIVAAIAVASTPSTTAEVDLDLVRHVAGLPVFAGIAPASIEAILARRRMRGVIAGEVILRQGEPPDRFAIIVDGRFDVTRREPGASNATHLRTLGPDDVFGEIGLLTGVPRTATVTAVTDGRLLELEGVDFLELVAAGPGLSSRFLDLHRGSRAARTPKRGAPAG
jgi:MFS family permease